MAAISTFVSVEEAKQLTFGSYEYLKSQVESAIETSRSQLFGSDAAVQVLGTFPGYAIVLSEDARVFRVKYERNDRGDVVPITAEAMSVPVYSKTDPASFALREAQAYVSAFLGGAKSLAAEHLSNLLPIVREKVAPPTPARLTESLDTLVKSERSWKKLYTERLAQIRSAVKDELPKLDENRLQEKFRRLYDGSVPAAQLPDYKGLVTSDLQHLSERIDQLSEHTAQAVESLKGAVPALKQKQNDPTVQMFESFAEDYQADLNGIRKALSEAKGLLNNVDDFGKIYDVLANELHRYEVAAKFVESMSSQLAKVAATEEG